MLLLTWTAVNLVRSQVGRNWMAIRDMDTAAAVIGIPVVRYKHLAFAVSSFYLGIAGALWAFAYLGTASASSFDINRSFQILFIIIIGGMGSIAGNFVGAAFISLLPILLSHAGQALFGGAVDAGAVAESAENHFWRVDHRVPDQGTRGLDSPVAQPSRSAASVAPTFLRPIEENFHACILKTIPGQCGLCVGGVVRCRAPGDGLGRPAVLPLATYRVGAYASSGVQVWAGMIDYLRYINEVEGGINGVKLVWQECETEWTAEKGISATSASRMAWMARRSRCISPTARRRRMP